MEPIVISIEDRKHSIFKESALGKRFSEIAEDDVQLAPFGSDYAGKFVLKHPTLRDRTEIAKVQTGELTKGDFTSWQLLPQRIKDLEYAFAAVEVLGQEKPEWFKRETLYTEVDQLAVIEVGEALNEVVESKGKRS